MLQAIGILQTQDKIQIEETDNQDNNILHILASLEDFSEEVHGAVIDKLLEVISLKKWPTTCSKKKRIGS